MNHSFDIDHAQTYGIVEAILISNFQFWIARNKANGENNRNDRTWTYNSVKAYAAQFPYLSHDQVRRALDKLVLKEVLIVGNYNVRGMDQTKWFAFKDENKFIPHLANLPDAFGKTASPSGKSAKSLITTDINTNTEPLSASQKRASRITLAWKLPKHFGEWTLEKYPTWTPEFIRERGEKFRDHWCAISGKAGLKTDWLATWRNFCLSEAEFIARTTRAPGTAGSPGGAPWWSSDESIIAESTKRGMSSRPGESIHALRGRIQAAINAEASPTTDPKKSAPVSAPAAPVPAIVTPVSAEVAAARSASLKQALSAMNSKVISNE